MTEPADLLKLASETAIEAGALLREAAATGFGRVETKSTDVDIVTEADQASERLIVHRLTSVRPDDGLLGEEGSSVEGSSGVEWIIDPLDGTVNFTYGIPVYAVSIGVEVNGVPTAGVVYNPATGELFSASIGNGAFLNGEPISVRNESALSRALVATGFAYAAERRGLQGATAARVLPQVRDIRRLGSAALDLCAVACGRIDAYYELYTNAWDVSAGSVIAAEAGAVVTELHSSTSPRTSALAANSTLHSALRNAIDAA